MSKIDKAVGIFKEIFNYDEGIQIYSAPGRSEIGGNHTDHQNGCVLAAAINKEAIAVAAPKEKIVTVSSDGFDKISIDINSLDIRENEKGSTAALIRGVLSGIKARGYSLGGFDAYIRSEVLIGKGLSSSAAFETLIATIISGMYNDMRIPSIEVAQIGQYAENEYFGKPCGLMDQAACSLGGLVFIDFENKANPKTEKIEFDFEKAGYSIAITDTHASHADLTDDYAKVPYEMTAVANLLGKEKLRGITQSDLYNKAMDIRTTLGDRAFLRALHFVNENERAREEALALKNNDIIGFLKLVKESGDSSYKFLQNVYSPSSITEQNIAVGIGISESFLKDNGVVRVHGGGFAGTIQAFVKTGKAEEYKQLMDLIFGDGSCEILNIRNNGGTRIK
ncbi:MAG: galactokinase [Saccharofermentans sp.]|nr:galactokinase [Saccharofermentans sp.]